MTKQTSSKNALSLYFLLFFLIAVHSFAFTQTKKNRKPNIILILTDDQGYGDVGFNGNEIIKTPVLDQLKHKSMYLTNFYVSPVCSPTRASIMTGKFAIRTGIYDTYNGGSLMAGEETTIAEVLKDNGYKTGIFGKWHLGPAYPLRPSDQGFEESLIHKGGGIGQPGDPDNFHKGDSSYFDPVLYHNNKRTKTNGYCSDVFTEGLLSFIEENEDEPFFAYLAFNAPHDPLQVPQKWYDMYKEENFEAHSNLNISEKNKDRARRVYGMISNIDYNIGRVIEKLKAQKIDKETIIIFLSDNGPWSIRYNAGLRDRKGKVYDGGVKSPCIIYNPLNKTTLPEISTPFAHIDLYPTILDLCNAELPNKKDIDGMSMLASLNGSEGDAFEKRNLYEQWGRMFPERYQNMSIRKGYYKLLAFTQYDADIDQFQLYNTKEDPSESNNLVTEKKDLALQLKNELDQWYEKEVIINNHPRNVHIKLNPSEEPVLRLTRNELKGSPAPWKRDEQDGYWDLEVEEEGNYDVTFFFRETAKQKGRMIVKHHPLQVSSYNDDTEATTLTMKNIFFKKGKAHLEVLYRADNWKFIIPFYVEIKKAE